MSKYQIEFDRPIDLLKGFLSDENLEELKSHAYLSVDSVLGVIEVSPVLVQDWLKLTPRQLIKLVFKCASYMDKETLEGLAIWEAPKRGMGLIIKDESQGL